MNDFITTLESCFGSQGEPWAEQDNSNIMRILRTYHDELATTSEWIFPSGEEIVGLENPWLDNKQFDSCIPEGIYAVKLRESQIVQRTTKGEFTQGYELVDVDGRTGIIIHIGNYVEDTDGCPLTGTTIGEKNGVPCVWSSSDAFRKFMGLMAEEDITHVSIEKKEEVE